ncbi:hypothetical protein ACFXB4_31025 [Streptomyces lavendulae]
MLDEPLGRGRGGPAFALGGDQPLFRAYPVAGALEVLDLDAFQEAQEVQP